MYYDKFDIISAYYLYCSHNHSGMGSKLYSRLCKILTYFKPSHNLSYDTLTDNGKEIYDGLYLTTT